jgi:DNA phosphorothioation-dependent restriction protein DptG
MLDTSLRSTVHSTVEELFNEMQMNASLFHADDAEAYVFPHWRELLVVQRAFDPGAFRRCAKLKRLFAARSRPCCL